MIELKLDVDTLLEWQKHSQENNDVPPYEDLFSFIDVRVQALNPQSDCKPLIHSSYAFSFVSSCWTCSAVLGLSAIPSSSEN